MVFGVVVNGGPDILAGAGHCLRVRGVTEVEHIDMLPASGAPTGGVMVIRMPRILPASVDPRRQMHGRS